MKRVLPCILALLLPLTAHTQSKRAMTIDDLVIWNRISERVISDDGSLIAFKTEPTRGDATVTLYNGKGDLVETFGCATGIRISADSRFLFFTIKPPLEEVRELKLKKAKREEMPTDKLGIYNLSTGVTDTIVSLKSYKLPGKWAGWVAWQCEPAKAKPAPAADTTSNNGDKPKKAKSQSAENGFTLYIVELQSGRRDSVPFVTDYLFAEEGKVLIYATTGDDNEHRPGVVVVNLESGTRQVIADGKGRYKQLTLDKKGSRAAFICSTNEKEKAGNSYSLYMWDGSGEAAVAASQGSAGLPEGWIVNEHARLSFAETAPRLYFGTSPAYRLKDTTLLDEERAVVDVWHWSEGILHTAQVVRQRRETNRSYTAVWHADSRKVVQLATTVMPDIQLSAKGDGGKAVAFSTLPYDLESMWRGSAGSDVWLVDIATGRAEQIKENLRARMRFSPAGNYLYWYQAADSSWYAYDVRSGSEVRLTTPATLRVWNELNDVPDLPGSYPAVGWLKDDKAFLVSDRYDIWSLDPSAAGAPRNITVNGRQEGIRYRLLRLDTENEYIDPAERQLLNGTSEKSRSEWFYSLDLRRKGVPVKLTGGDYTLGVPVKARNSSRLIYTRENFGLFPDYLLTDLTFRNEKRLTNANPQQQEFLWGTAEVVSWISHDGLKLEGLLYKPENFDPSRKYPMIVNFYEKSSTELNRHRIPEPGRSTIDYHYYTSNGYLIFNPDVYYTDGYPGQSAYNCVMPGVMSLIDRGFVDEKRIGAQGHSWGGYQVAYLATRTNLFAAIESGAPVVNMFSAYGGIRWESGANRSMQYEHQQSRIGATIWEAPHLFWENSPLFAIEKVETPILIMANDQDGAVPWYQGIEFFIAMRRLGKPAWLLNYNGEPHWAQTVPNRVDFQRRMAQFFHHYLKDEPMPPWMKEGVPATDKEFTLGY